MNKTIKRLKWCIVAIGLLTPIASPAGITFTNIFSFNGTNGFAPLVLVQAGNNKFYGITEGGGANFTGPSSPDVGGVFSITSDGVFSNLFFFEGTNGDLGEYLTPGSDGNFYGTTQDTVFKLNPDGTMANPHLAALPSNSGPVGLVQDHDGTLYGIIEGDESSLEGAIYRIDTNGAFSTFVTFSGTNDDQPSALLLGSDDSFYGLSLFGGNDSSAYPGDGSIFRMDRNGNLTNIFLFSDLDDEPIQLVQGSDGDLYGSTLFGGTNGLGSIFRVTTNGVLVWSFSFNGTNGDLPFGLIMANDGNFYGVTIHGGSNFTQTVLSGYGTIFRITPGGSLTSLAEFDGTNDSMPWTIVQGTDGNLYGVAQAGGTYGDGAIFKLTLPACPCTNQLMLTSVYNFYDGNSFDFPEGGLIQAGDGMLYGITAYGGAFQGALFSGRLSQVHSPP